MFNGMDLFHPILTLYKMIRQKSVEAASVLAAGIKFGDA
jgi:hypothetical protein